MTIGNGVIGYRVKDIITGFTGIATAHCVYISGCNQVLVSPGLDKDGKLMGSHWFDEQRLQLVGGKQKRYVKLDNTKTPGFDQEAPKR